MLVISLGLHALVLWAPISESTPEEPEAVKTAQPTRPEDVKITELLASPPPAPKPPPLAKRPAPPLQTSKPTLPAAPLPERRIVPIPAPAPAAQPTTPAAVPQQAEVSPSPQPSPAPKPDPSVIAASFETAFSQLPGQVAEENIDFTLFKEPEAFYEPESLKPGAQGEPKPGVDRITWIERKSPEEVTSEILKPQLQAADLELIPENSYGGGALYQLKQEGFSRYISLVPISGLGKGTMMVIWSRDPNAPLTP